MNIKINKIKILLFLSGISQLSVCLETASQEAPSAVQPNQTRENPMISNFVTEPEQQSVEEVKVNNDSTKSTEPENQQKNRTIASNSVTEELIKQETAEQADVNHVELPNVKISVVEVHPAALDKNKKNTEESKNNITCQLVEEKMNEKLTELFTFFFIDKNNAKIREEFLEKIALAVANKIPESSKKHLEIKEIKDKLANFGESTVFTNYVMELKSMKELLENGASKEDLQKINERMLAAESKIQELAQLVAIKQVEKPQEKKILLIDEKEKQEKDLQKKDIAILSQSVEKILVARIDAMNEKQTKFKELCLYVLAGCVVTFTAINGYLYYIMMKNTENNNVNQDD